MMKYALVTTLYSYQFDKPTKESVKLKFNYDGSIEDLHINFSNTFDPWHKDHLNVGMSGRKDLIYGKIYLLREFIRENLLGKYEYICHIDYSDTKFARSFIEMMNRFELTNQDFIISTEKNCWPPIGICSTWLNTPLPELEFYYINSGAIIGKTSKFLFYLDELFSLCENVPVDYWDDQGVWQYYNLSRETLNADTNCEYFFSTANLDDTYYTIEEGKILTKFNTQPYLIHDNSSFSLNLIAKI